MFGAQEKLSSPVKSAVAFGVGIATALPICCDGAFSNIISMSYSHILQFSRRAKALILNGRMVFPANGGSFQSCPSNAIGYSIPCCITTFGV